MKQMTKWEKLTNQITESFIRDYWEVEEDEKLDYSWVGSEIGGVFEFADYYFNFATVLNCYKHYISRDSLFRWYDMCLEGENIKLSLIDFVKSPEKLKKEKEKYLQELKKRCIFAEETFNKALEDYGSM